MKKIGLLFSHRLTKKQEEELNSVYGITRFVYLPEDKQKKWANVPADIENVEYWLKDIVGWVEQNFVKGDYLLIQGDFGAVCYMVTFAFEKDLVPIYATTVRVHKEIEKDDVIMVSKIFKHVRFRIYEVYDK